MSLHFAESKVLLLRLYVVGLMQHSPSVGVKVQADSARQSTRKALIPQISLTRKCLPAKLRRLSSFAFQRVSNSKTSSEEFAGREEEIPADPRQNSREEL